MKRCQMGPVEVTNQSPKRGVTNSASGCPFHKLRFASSFRFHPNAFPHLFCCESVAGAVRFGQVDEPVFRRFETTECLEDFITQMWREPLASP